MVKKSPLVKGLRICLVCPDRMLLCSHTASRRDDGEGGIAQIRDHLLTSVQGLATTFVGICFTMCGATHCWGKVCRMARELASSLINTSRRAEVTGAKVNIDLEQLELLRASQVSVPLCLAAAPVPVTAGIMLGGQGQPLQQHARAVKAAQRSFVWLLLLFSCCNCALLLLFVPNIFPAVTVAAACFP